MLLLCLSVVSVLVPVVGILLDGRSDRSVRVRSTVDAVVHGPSFAVATWNNYGPDVQRYDGAVCHADGTARPVPSSVARYL